MRTALILFVIGCWLRPVAAQDNVRTLSQHYAFDADGQVELTTYKGTITVEPWMRDEIQIDVRIEAEDLDGLIMLPDVEIEIGGSEMALEIETDYRKAIRRIRDLFDPEDNPRLPLVHYVIRLPVTAHLKIEDYMSETEVRGFYANLDLYTYKGSARLTDFGGSLKLDTFSGRADVVFLPKMRDSSIGSHQGQIQVALPLDAAFDLDVDLMEPAGYFLADTTFAELRGTTPLIRKPERDENAYLGAVNGGGPRLNLVTHTGAVRLAAQ